VKTPTALLDPVFIPEKYEIEKYTIDTIFIGGGTPTAPDNDLLEKLLFEIDGNFSFSDDLECSIEINPNSIEEEKVKMNMMMLRMLLQVLWNL